MKSSRFFLRNLITDLVPIWIPLIIPIGFVLFLATSVIETQQISEMDNMLYQLRTQMDFPFTYVDGLIQNFASYYPSTINYFRSLLNKQYFSLEDIRSFNLVLSTLSSFINSSSSIYSVYIYYDNPHGQFISSSSGIVDMDTYWDTEWADKIDDLSESDVEYYAYPRKMRQAASDDDGLDVITMIVRDLELSGCLVFNIRRSYYENILNLMFSFPEDKIFVMDQNDNELLSFSDTEFPSYLIGENKMSGGIDIENTAYYYWVLPSSRMGWTYYVLRPVSEVDKVFYTILLELILLIIISSISSIIVAGRITRKNNLWIEEIINLLNQSESGRTIEAVKKNSDLYTQIVHNILQAFLETKYLKAHQKSLELTALQAQINPHFLYNTLNAVYWESMKLGNGPSVVTDMIEHLTRLLEYTVSDPMEMVTFADEISYTKDYIAIQKYRFPDLFEVNWEIAEDILNAKIMKLFFQPLVENSIQHGFRDITYRGRIDICISKMHNGGISITVSDNGIGMDIFTLEKVRAAISSDGSNVSIGFANTMKRLRLFYGNDVSIDVCSEQSGGTIITITLP